MDTNHPVKFGESAIVSAFFLNNIVGNVTKYFVLVAHDAVKCYRQQKQQSGSHRCEEIIKDTDSSIFFIMTNIFMTEPRHVISNNVAFDMCRLRQACAAYL